jgi:chromosome segregation ATPase
MEDNVDKPDIKKETRELRKKIKRIEESRSSIKAKSHEKGKSIKAYQDRQTELEQNRDDWKARCKEQEKERKDADNKYKQVADMLEMKEQELQLILAEFEELKKKNLSKTHR